jgi:hypothetical protein
MSAQSRKANRETLRLLVIGLTVFLIGVAVMGLAAYAVGKWFFGVLPH